MDENPNEITMRLEGLAEQLAALEKRQRAKPAPKPDVEASSRRTVARVVGTVLVVLVVFGAVLAAWYWALQFGIVLPR
jgi:hypothetical protein